MTGGSQVGLARIFGTGFRSSAAALAYFGRQLARLLSASSPRAYRIALVVLGVLVVLMIGSLVYLRATHQRVNAWDSGFLLDGGWRLVRGQRPHTDFYSPFGAIPLLVVTLGLAVTRGSAAALTIGYAIIFPFVTFLAWWISRRRLSAVYALLFAGMVGLLTIGTHRLGASYRDVTYAMQYNRLGWALLAMVTLQLFLAPMGRRNSDDREADAGRGRRLLSSELLEGVSVGALLGLLLFTKITYFVTGVAMLVVAALLSARPWQSRRGRVDSGRLSSDPGVSRADAGGPLDGTGPCGLGIGFAVVVLAVLVYLRFDVVSFLGDMRMLSGAQSLAVRTEALKAVFSSTVGPLLLLGLVLVLAVIPLASAQRGTGIEPWRKPGHVTDRLRTWTPLISGAVIAAAGVLTCSANAQRGGIPLLGVAALIPLEMARRVQPSLADGGPGDRSTSAAPHPGNWSTRSWVVASLVAVFLVGSIFLADAESVAYSAGWKALSASKMPSSGRVQSASMKDLLFPPRRLEDTGQQAVVAAILRRPADEPYLTPQQYAAWLNDGLALLRRHVTDSSRVLSLDWFNPFPFALDLPSPRGDSIAWHLGLLVSPSHHPDPKRVLGDATFVMDPKRPIAPYTYGFKKGILKPGLAAGFEKVDESDLWILYERK